MPEEKVPEDKVRSLPLAVVGLVSVLALGQSNLRPEVPLSELRVAAQRGDSISQYQLAVRYLLGNDFAEAASGSKILPTREMLLQ